MTAESSSSTENRFNSNDCERTRSHSKTLRELYLARVDLEARISRAYHWSIRQNKTSSNKTMMAQLVSLIIPYSREETKATSKDSIPYVDAL